MTNEMPLPLLSIPGGNYTKDAGVLSPDVFIAMRYPGASSCMGAEAWPDITLGTLERIKQECMLGKPDREPTP